MMILKVAKCIFNLPPDLQSLFPFISANKNNKQLKHGGSHHEENVYKSTCTDNRTYFQLPGIRRRLLQHPGIQCRTSGNRRGYVETHCPQQHER